MKSRTFKLDKPIIRHFSFLYLELKSAIFRKDPAVGKFKFFKKLFVRYLIPYYESFKYYLFYKKKNFELENHSCKSLNLKEHGFEFLKPVNISKLNFIKYSPSINNKFISHNEIHYEEAESFARINFFNEKAKFYLETSECNIRIESWNINYALNEEEVPSNFWHRDRDGIKICKFFILLSDSSKETGGHEFIICSHLQKPFKFTPQFRYEDQKIRKFFKEKQFLQIFGRAGTCFVEDTTGFHKGVFPKKGKIRSLLVFTYFTGPLVVGKQVKQVKL